MSALTARQARRWELIVPLALLLVYTVCFGLYSLHRETKEGVEHARQDARRKVAVEMTHLQESLDYLLQKGELAAIRESLSSLGYNPLLQVGLLVDDQQTVLASTRLALIGHPAGEAWPEVDQPENARWRQQALKHMQGVVEASADGKSIIGYYPVPLSIGQAPRRVGYLFFQHDLTELENASRYTAERSVLRSMVLLLVIAGGMGLIVYALLGQRIRRLVTATEGMAEQIGRSREQLRENEERFQTLVDRSPDAIFVHREGSIVFANPAAGAVVGYERAEELQGRKLAELVQHGDEEALTESADEQGMREVHWVHRSGRLVLGEVVTFPLVFEAQPARVSIVRDITERKHLREKLQTADRMASIGALASGVAHEINNPLSFMLSNLRFVRDEFKELPEGWDALAKERLKEIQEALGESLEGGERVNEIVQDLRRFARGDDGKRAPVNLHTVLDLCGSIARSQLRHRAQLVKAYGELPPVHASESRLGQLFLNLIVNAAQAIPEGADAKANEVRITTWREGADQVAVEVKDTGVGIPPENLHRLFDPFFTTKPVGVGTGLGLSISLNIVKAMGGRITVDSEPGKGTAFRVFLPVGEAGAAPVSESSGGQHS
jgi:two-component system NtrC family sensor kinase